MTNVSLADSVAVVASRGGLYYFSLAIIIEFISKKKVSNILVHIISIIAAILVICLSIILIVGYFRVDYYNTTYIPGS